MNYGVLNNIIVDIIIKVGHFAKFLIEKEGYLEKKIFRPPYL